MIKLIRGCDYIFTNQIHRSHVDCYLKLICFNAITTHCLNFNIEKVILELYEAAHEILVFITLSSNGGSGVSAHAHCTD